MYPSIINLTIETSTFCNAECMICPNSQPNNRREPHLMQLHDFESILRLFPNLSSISLCGCYEPLSDNHLPKIFDIIKKVNPKMNITIFSNGSLLHKWEDLLLNNENLNSIIFSVHGFSPIIYNKLMKNLDRDETYSNILHFIEKRRTMKKTNPKIAVSFVKTSVNLHEFNEFKKFWKQNKIDDVHNFELMNWNNKVKSYDTLIDKPKITSRSCSMYEVPMVIDAFCNIVRCCYNVSFIYGSVFKDGIEKYLLKKRVSDTYPDFDCIKCDGWKI